MTYKFERITVLVVEDNQPMMDITKSLLTTFGVRHVIEAKNAEIGFRWFQEYNPDIIIADWMMKPIDGIAFTRLIRTSPESPNPYVPIILMTGYSKKRRVLEARDAGVTEFLVKPFTARDLYKRIVQTIERPRQFVRSEDFFGPDRRRSKKKLYTGPLRRRGDDEDEDEITSSDEDHGSSKAQQQKEMDAHKKLKEIREKAGLMKGEGFNLDDEGRQKSK